MNFYSQIAEAYDELFPFNENQLLFVELALGGQFRQKVILDMGCGTGILSTVMARRSARVRGFDLDKSMIARAEERRPQALDLQFRKGGMKTVAKDYPPGLFDAVLCLGNTLVHLNDKQAVEKLFRDVAGLLRPGGRFIFQIINYDRIAKEQVQQLPAIETGHYKFERHYNHRSDGRIDFNTALYANKGLVTKNSVVLLPLYKSWLEESLRNIFSHIEFNGGFDRSEWAAASYHTIGVATL